MFEIVNEAEKKVFVSLHMEEIYSRLQTSLLLESGVCFFAQNEVSEFCLENLKRTQLSEESFADYECILDFSRVGSVFGNQKKELREWMRKWKGTTVYFGNTKNEGIKSEWEKEFGLAESGYRAAFQSYAKAHIRKHCYEERGYTTQTGTELSVYINLKKIAEDTKELFRWCYMIADGLYENPYFQKKQREGGMMFFCHTLNGSAIAGVLSFLLGCDLAYVDHLGPYNKLNKIDFRWDSYESKEYVIVSDMVCQGNEILRAKNLVEYLGGDVCGYAGFVKLDISDIPAPNWVESFATVYPPKEAREDLHYIIKTRLCNPNCSGCKEGHGCEPI